MRKYVILPSLEWVYYKLVDVSYEAYVLQLVYTDLILNSQEYIFSIIECCSCIGKAVLGVDKNIMIWMLKCLIKIESDLLPVQDCWTSIGVYMR